MNLLRSALLCMALYATGSGVASPITRMDVFDKADNRLLFVTFEYNSAGDCIGRSVFASDSTFLRSVTVQPGSAVAATKEISVDYIGNALFTTTINPPSSGKTTFTTVDQFGLSQFGAPLSYAETSTNAFDVAQGNNILGKEQYEFDGNGALTRITMLDKNGALSWYAVVSQATNVSGNNGPRTALRPARVTADRGNIRLRFDLPSDGVVFADLFTPAGRKALSMVNTPMSAGNHQVTADCAVLGTGTYIVKMTVNGIAFLTRKIAIQR
ncbi:MAG TPA: hypothetical protein VF335_08400 [Chitinivibrionales bacterium]